ncbi:MAG: DUF1549 domain-containing protein [Planctomycetota bacterium]
MAKQDLKMDELRFSGVEQMERRITRSVRRWVASFLFALCATGCWAGIGLSATPAQEQPATASAETAAPGAQPAAAVAQEVAAPAPAVSPTPTGIAVYPDSIQLATIRDSQSLVVQLQWSNGVTSDATTAAAFQIADPAITRVEGATFFPLADGTTKVSVAVQGFTIEVPVTVSQATADPPISFANDVMPVFSKAGCNTGSCHGAARGKDGFRLSLYGFDPNGDHFRLTRDMLGRRINLAVPEDCLLVNKAVGAVPHTGGGLLSRDSQHYQTLVRWLNVGAPNDSGPVPAVVGLEIFPAGAVLNGPDQSQQLTVRAKYADGSDRDVTDLAYFMTSNDSSALVSQEGLVTAKARGEAFVMARFDTHTQGIHVIVLPKDFEFSWPEIAENNYIDTLVHNKLRKLRIIPSGICSDDQFIRRVSLDICGIVPTADEVRAFLVDTDPQKRSKLIDRLLERKEFVELWVMKWSELLQIRSTPQVSYKATLMYYNWLQEKISSNMPVDQMVRELLGSEGGTFTNAATNYYQAEQDTLKVAENVAQVFLGTRIQCAQCHNHPFDRWTMNDYYQFAAFFSQVGRKAGTDPRETIVFNRGGGEVNHPVTGQPMPPKYLGGAQPETAGQDRRKLLAGWLASKENEMFTQNLANVVWAHFFGRGIVNEVDDVRVSNPPSNPELLAELGKKFAEYNFDFKSVVRDICNSRTYQLDTQTNPTNELDSNNFSHSQLRRIRAEVLLDVISQITETQNKFRGLPTGARAVQIADGNTSTYFLNTFGRATRETVCSCEVKMEPNLSQALHLINGDTVQQKIQQGQVIDKLLSAGKTPEQVIEELYLRCRSRLPQDSELAALRAGLAETPEPKVFLEDLFWSLLNSPEFVFNH